MEHTRRKVFADPRSEVDINWAEKGLEPTAEVDGIILDLGDIFAPS